MTGGFLLLMLVFGQNVKVVGPVKVAGPVKVVAGASVGSSFASVAAVADRAANTNKLTCAGTGCTLTVPSTGSAHAMTLWAFESNGNKISSVANGGTWQVPTTTGCQPSSGPVGQLSVAYVLSSSSGTTSISITFAGTVSDVTVIYNEVSWSGSSVTFDTCAANNPGTNGSTTATGPTLSIAGTEMASELISLSADIINSAASPWDTNFVNQNNIGGGLGANAGSFVLNNPPNAASSWTLNSAEFYIVAAIVLKGN